MDPDKFARRKPILDVDRLWYEERAQASRAARASQLQFQRLPTEAPSDLAKFALGKLEPDLSTFDDGVVRKHVRLQTQSLAGYGRAAFGNAALASIVEEYGALVELYEPSSGRYRALAASEHALRDGHLVVHEPLVDANELVVTFFEYVGANVDHVPVLLSGASGPDGALARRGNVWVVEPLSGGNAVLTTSDQVTEGVVNKYFTEDRFDDRLAGKSTVDLQEGPGRAYATRARLERPTRGGDAVAAHRAASPAVRTEPTRPPSAKREIRSDEPILPSSARSRREAVSPPPFQKSRLPPQPADNHFKAAAKPEQRQEPSLALGAQPRRTRTDASHSIAAPLPQRASLELSESKLPHVRAPITPLPPASAEATKRTPIDRPETARRPIEAQRFRDVMQSVPAASAPGPKRAAMHKLPIEQPKRTVPFRSSMMMPTQPQPQQRPRRVREAHVAAAVPAKREGTTAPEPSQPRERRDDTGVPHAPVPRTRSSAELLPPSQAGARAADVFKLKGELAAASASANASVAAVEGGLVGANAAIAALDEVATRADAVGAAAYAAANLALNEVGVERERADVLEVGLEIERQTRAQAVAALRSETGLVILEERAVTQALVDAQVAAAMPGVDADASQAAANAVAAAVPGAVSDELNVQIAGIVGGLADDVGAQLSASSAVRWASDGARRARSDAAVPPSHRSAARSREIALPSAASVQQQRAPEEVPPAQLDAARFLAPSVQKKIDQRSSNVAYAVASSILSGLDASDLSDASGVFVSRQNVRNAGVTTDDVLEGASQYFTEERARVAVRQQVDIAELTDESNLLLGKQNLIQQGIDTDDFVEGNTNIYWTQQRFDTAYAAVTEERHRAEGFPSTTVLRASRDREVPPPSGTLRLPVSQRESSAPPPSSSRAAVRSRASSSDVPVQSGGSTLLTARVTNLQASLTSRIDYIESYAGNLITHGNVVGVGLSTDDLLRGATTPAPNRISREPETVLPVRVPVSTAHRAEIRTPSPMTKRVQRQRDDERAIPVAQPPARESERMERPRAPTRRRRPSPVDARQHQSLKRGDEASLAASRRPRERSAREDLPTAAVAQSRAIASPPHASTPLPAVHQRRAASPAALPPPPSSKPARIDDVAPQRSSTPLRKPLSEAPVPTTSAARLPARGADEHSELVFARDRALHGDVGRLRMEFGELRSTFNALDSNTLQNLSDASNVVDAAVLIVDSMEDRVVALEAQGNALVADGAGFAANDVLAQASLGVLHANVAALDAQVALAEGRVLAVEDGVVQLQSSLGAVRDEANAAAAHAEANAAAIAGLEMRVGGTEAQLVLHGAQLEDLGQLVVHDARLDALEAQSASASANAVLVRSNVAALQSSLGSLQDWANVENAAQNAAGLVQDARLDALEANGTVFEAALARETWLREGNDAVLGLRADELESNVLGLQTATFVLEGRADGLRVDVNELDAEIEAMDVSLGALGASFNAANAHLLNLQEQHDANADLLALRAQRASSRPRARNASPPPPSGGLLSERARHDELPGPAPTRPRRSEPRPPRAASEPKRAPVSSEHARFDLTHRKTQGRVRQHFEVPPAARGGARPKAVLPSRPVLASWNWQRVQNGLGDLHVEVLPAEDSSPVQWTSGMLDGVSALPVTRTRAGGTFVMHFPRVPSMSSHSLVVVAHSDAGKSRELRVELGDHGSLLELIVPASPPPGFDAAALANVMLDGDGVRNIGNADIHAVFSLGTLTGRLKHARIDMFDAANLQLAVSVVNETGWLDASGAFTRVIAPEPILDGDPCVLTCTSSHFDVGFGALRFGEFLTSVVLPPGMRAPIPRLVI